MSASESLIENVLNFRRQQKNNFLSLKEIEKKFFEPFSAARKVSENDYLFFDV
jgi:hypothetical protein